MTPPLSQIPSINARRYRSYAPWIILIAGLVAFFVFRGGAPANSAPTSPSATVTSVVAERRDVPNWITGVGTVTPLNVVTVRSRVDGQLDKMVFQEGQMVSAGDLLAEIDPRPYQAQLTQAQGNVTRDDAQRRNAELDLSRYQKLSSLQVVPRQQLDAQKAQAESLLATVATDRGAVEAARLNLSFTRITAPISGRVGQRLVDQGAQVHTTDTTGLVTITQIEPMTVTFPVSQDLLGEVAAEQQKEPLTVVVTARDGSATLGTGTLVFIDSQVASGTGQVLLKAQFDNHDHALWPGAFVAARLLLSTQPKAITVPSQAIQRDQAGDFVYVIGADGIANLRRVKVGLEDGGFTAISDGIAVGERVIVEGQGDIQPGMHVSEAPRRETVATT